MPAFLRTAETAAPARVINRYCAANKELIEEYRRTEECVKELKNAPGILPSGEQEATRP
ncbi:MAG: hypothetical protein LBP78_07255 [Acidaminococcales bacterium]|nr:hypothetical protein [Acidaminococcales bacterium]